MKKIVIAIVSIALVLGLMVITHLKNKSIENYENKIKTQTTISTTTSETTTTTTKKKKAKAKKKKHSINVKGYNIKYNKSEIIEYLHVMVLAYGWDEEEYKSAYKLMNNESGFNPNNINRATTTGACGLAQAHPCSKVPHQYEIDWKYQVRWFLDYIKYKYKKPSIAYNKWLKSKPHSY